MSAKYKAMALLERYKEVEMPRSCSHPTIGVEAAKACAIIAVDEIIDSYNQYKDMYDQGAFDAEKQYWNDVKKQIELL